MQNPFESGHIKNYLLLYASVVVIMILFFIASTLFHDVEKVDKKTFNTKVNKDSGFDKDADERAEENSSTNKFRVLDRAY